MKVKATFKYGEATQPANWDNAHHNWKVVLRYEGRQLTTNFYGGSAVTNPTVADVLSSLILDSYAGELDFADFCADYGYDYNCCEFDCEKNRIRKTWKQCQKLGKGVRRLLGNNFAQFADKEH